MLDHLKRKNKNSTKQILKDTMKLGYIVIYVADVEQTLNFYVKAFNYTIKFLHEEKSYGELDTGATTLAFSQELFTAQSLGQFEKNRPNKPPAGFEIALVADNVLASYQYAVASGAKILHEPVRKPWGQTVAYVLDCNNVIIEICSPM
jgi:predicted enzyme related to lactoylglutathione lyase